MAELKALIYKILYKVAVRLKPLSVKFFSPKVRQQIKHRLLKTAFPLQKNDESTHFIEGISGINLVGYARAEMGIGESCRIAARSITAVDNINFGIINFTGTNSARMNDTTWIHKEIAEPKYNINLFHINAEQMIEVYSQYGNSIFKNRYNIGYWHWELPDFPDDWKESFNLVNEIWVPSTFIADSIAQKSPVPVVKIPHSIEVPIQHMRDRAYYNLPQNAFLFLTMYDLKSYQERKNPKASIRAFQTAFLPDDHSVGLVVKVNGVGYAQTDLDELHEIIGEHKNVYLIEETLTRNDTNALISVTDSYISLHRSEGFGLGLAEAMYLGKPVIGTGWSSNLDFMNHDNSCLVSYTLVNLKQDFGPYKAYQYWADPDIEHASYYMRKLYDDRNYYEQLSSKGEAYIKQHFSPHTIGGLIQKRLEYISIWKFGG
ncbi:glycosyltransferase [Paenibacillus sp. CC-CFT742]|nr:glycosyltransferase [Paenibacillus sp. CC-CFT742]WJH27529.1 glycosyltransferase [Paenibacillus sp. CC-CFT742]